MRHLPHLAVLLNADDRRSERSHPNSREPITERTMSSSRTSLIAPVTVSAVVPAPRTDVYAFLEQLKNHVGFTAHMFSDWSFDGPRSGIGARAQMRVSAAGRRDRLSVEIVRATPVQLVERSISANGKRVTIGTYTLRGAEPGHTRVTFELAWTAAPLIERLLAPITRAVVRRQNEQAMASLTGQSWSPKTRFTW
jgi:hypothetical protein